MIKENEGQKAAFPIAHHRIEGMTERDFIELISEDIEDMFGPDWRNYLEDFEEEKNKRSYFLTRLHGTGLEKL